MHSLKEGARQQAAFVCHAWPLFLADNSSSSESWRAGKGGTQWPHASGHVHSQSASWPVGLSGGGASVLHQVARAPSDEHRCHRHCRVVRSEEFVRLGNTCPPIDPCPATHTLPAFQGNTGTMTTCTSTLHFLCFSGVILRLGNFRFEYYLDGGTHALYVCLHTYTILKESPSPVMLYPNEPPSENNRFSEIY